VVLTGWEDPFRLSPYTIENDSNFVVKFLSRYLAMLRQAPKPLWIHCPSGADRTGLVAALYLFAIEGQRAQAAAQQLSLS
jgi:protein tyrosine/serine phosphatase